MVSAEELALVEEGLRGAVTSNVMLLATAGEHVICSGGKRIRPKLVLLSYKAAGGKDVSEAVPLAVAVELLHTASLVHDDINDRSDMRRGDPSVNAKWGDGLALLVGDFIFIKLLNLMPNFDSRAIRVLSESCTAIVEGETLHVLNRGDAGMTEKTYLDIVGRKTAALFSACTELGALVAGGSEEQVAALMDYGYDIGVAFQIRDDVLDVVGNKDGLGKPVANDLGQGKMSLATLFALRTGETAEDVLFSSDAARARQVLADTGAIDYAVSKAREYSSRGKEALSILPDSAAKAALCELADFVVARDR